MGYEYTDPKRASEPTALPDVEVFRAETIGCDFCDCIYPDYAGDGIGQPCQCESCEDVPEAVLTQCEPRRFGYYFAFGFPGCLWDGEPEGPFDSEAEALDAARELAGVYDDES